jgi:hypothetical protein
MMRVGSLAEAKDWGCGREIFWFSWTTAGGSPGNMEKERNHFFGAFTWAGMSAVP